MLGAALTAALRGLGWNATAAPVPARRPLLVVVVENNEGEPCPPHPDAGNLRVAVCLGTGRSLDALLPLVRLGAVPLNQDAPFVPLVLRASWILARAQTASAGDPWQLLALHRRRAEAAGLARLTPSERRVLGMLAEGSTARVIADRTNRSEHTVRSQIRSVLAKLQIDSQLVAVAIAHRAGAIPISPEHLHFTHFGDAHTLAPRR